MTYISEIHRKLTDAQVAEARQAFRDGASIEELRDRYGYTSNQAVKLALSIFYRKVPGFITRAEFAARAAEARR